jgi:hypothetical protein
MMTPQRGDKLYKCWNGTLESVVFLEASIAPGCSGVTWVVQEKGGKRYRVAPDFYPARSAREAWQVYLGELREALPRMEQSAQEALDAAASVKQEIRALESQLAADA